MKLMVWIKKKYQARNRALWRAKDHLGTSFTLKLLPIITSQYQVLSVLKDRKMKNRSQTKFVFSGDHAPTV